MSDELLDSRAPISRSFAVDDLVVRSDGDGRLVDAYAAVFNTPAEIKDGYGHYFEVIDRSAFDVSIKRGTRPLVLFNHGRDIFGNAAAEFSKPIGRAESIIADGRGLRTTTRINNTALGDDVLELLRSGSVDGFSFTARPLRSKPIPPAGGEGLRTVVRQELALQEYGPAVFQAYADARLLAVRSQELAEEISALDPDQLAELVSVLRTRVPDLALLGRSEDPSVQDDVTPPADPAADEFNARRRLMAARLRGIL